MRLLQLVSDSISRILWAIARPSSILVVLALVGLIASINCRRCKIAKSLLVVGLGGLCLITFLPIGSSLMRPLEDRFPPERVAGPIDGIIILGGAIDVA